MQGDQTHETVFVVDDDPSVRQTLVGLITAAGIHAEGFETAEDYLRVHTPDRAGCILLDLKMPGMGGLELQRELRRRECIIPIIFYSAFGTVDTAVQAMKDGAVFFAQKPCEPSVLLRQIRDALEVDRQNRSKDRLQKDLQTRMNTLTPREREILQHVIAGKTSRQIAKELYLSDKTVQLHRANIMRKVDARGVAELVRMAVQASGGEVTSPPENSDGQQN